MAILRACTRLPETVQERVETASDDLGGGIDGGKRLERSKGLWRRFWPLSSSGAQG